MTKSKAARAGIGYTIANILIRGIGFLTLPIFSRLLDTYDFGVYNVFIAYDSILFVVIGFALHSSLKSANWEFPKQIDDYVSSISLLYIANMVFLIVLVLIFGPFISSAIGFDSVVMACLVVHSFGTAITALYNNRVSLQYSYKKYMVVALASSLGNVLLSLVLIFTVFYGQRYMGRILGATIVLAVLGAILVLCFWRAARPRVNLKYWSFGLKYSLPIVAHGLSQVVLAQFGRLMINYMVSTEAAGIYGLAANLMIIVTVLTDSVSTVWTTWFYETMEGEEADKATELKMLADAELKQRSMTIQRRAGQLAQGFAIICIALMAITPEMIWVLGGDAYMDGAYCAFGMILSGYCVFIYNMIVAGEYYKQKTNYIMIGTILAAIINIILNLWAIQAFGYIAAAYTTLVSYMFYVVFHWIISKRVLSFAVLGLRQLLLAAMVLGLCAVMFALLFDYVFARILAGVIICLVFFWRLLKNTGGLTGLKGILGK